MTPQPIIECVPNFSEGRNTETIAQITEAVAQVKGVRVLHVDSGYDANRTVLTFAGRPESVEEAAFQCVRKAMERIDMRTQKGTHPRLGAVDVLPLVPVCAVTWEEVVALSFRLSERVAKELSIPVYNYENSANIKIRRRLENIRSGEYEGLEGKMQDELWQPDYGSVFSPKSGATVIGARAFLLAYNVNLDTQNLAVAKEIAGLIRESGIKTKGMLQKGLFEGVKAIGWQAPKYGIVQVSTNITSTERVGMHNVYESVKQMARKKGISVKGSELIGLTPLRCILESGAFYAGEKASEDEQTAAAVEGLGLDSLSPFSPEKRIIEYLLR